MYMGGGTRGEWRGKTLHPDYALRGYNVGAGKKPQQ